MRIKNMGEKFIEFNLNAPNGPRNSWHLMGYLYLLLHPYLYLHLQIIPHPALDRKAWLI